MSKSGKIKYSEYEFGKKDDKFEVYYKVRGGKTSMKLSMYIEEDCFVTERNKIGNEKNCVQVNKKKFRKTKNLEGNHRACVHALTYLRKRIEELSDEEFIGALVPKNFEDLLKVNKDDFGGNVSTADFALCTDLKKVSDLETFFKEEKGVWIQPKFDGFRAFMDKEGYFYSRKKRQYNLSFEGNHLQKFFDEEKYKYLDGEILPISGNFNDLAKLNSNLQSFKTGELFYFMIFDLVPNFSKKIPFEERIYDMKNLQNLIMTNQDSFKVSSLVFVEGEEEVIREHEKNVSDGFEGTIIRRNVSFYPKGRSKYVYKLKNFLDDEFKICGVKDEVKNGKRLILFEVKLGEDNIIVIRPRGTEMEREDLLKRFENNDIELLGKDIWLRFQERTKDGSLRFPSTKTDSYLTYLRAF